MPGKLAASRWKASRRIRRDASAAHRAIFSEKLTSHAFLFRFSCKFVPNQLPILRAHYCESVSFARSGKTNTEHAVGVSGQRKALPGGRGKAGLLLERLGKQKRYISMIQTGRGVFLNQMCASFKIECLSYTANYNLRETLCGSDDLDGDFGC